RTRRRRDPPMIGEVVDTGVALGWALAAWIVVLAAAGTVVLLAGAVTGAFAVRGAWRGVVGAWGWLDARTRTRPRRALSARLTAELCSRDSTVPGTAERRSELQPRKEVA
ncbi:hypothetical protein, partial [Streptomyces antibioticus]|uniref:hypothetical protein n=1 Tax=Streptomyces antibioticus TaxID=1890 RepID=UPI0033FAD22F